MAPAQEQFVSNVADSLLEAAEEPGGRAVYWAVYEDETPVGFVMWSDEVEPGPDYIPHYLWKLLIDERYQGQGFGTATLDLVVEYFRSRPGVDALRTSASRATAARSGSTSATASSEPARSSSTTKSCFGSSCADGRLSWSSWTGTLTSAPRAAARRSTPSRSSRSPRRCSSEVLEDVLAELEGARLDAGSLREDEPRRAAALVRTALGGKDQEPEPDEEVEPESDDDEAGSRTPGARTTSRRRSRGSRKSSSRRGACRRRSSSISSCSPQPRWCDEGKRRVLGGEVTVSGFRRFAQRSRGARDRFALVDGAGATIALVIVRDQRGSWQVVLQTDHADLSGAVAEAWSDRGPRHDSAVVAARRHDDGWAVWERSPLVDAGGAPVRVPRRPRSGAPRVLCAGIAAGDGRRSLRRPPRLDARRRRLPGSATARTPGSRFPVRPRCSRSSTPSSKSRSRRSRRALGGRRRRRGASLGRLPPASVVRPLLARVLPAPVSDTPTRPLSSWARSSFTPLGPWRARVDPYPFAGTSASFTLLRRLVPRAAVDAG